MAEHTPNSLTSLLNEAETVNQLLAAHTSSIYDMGETPSVYGMEQTLPSQAPLSATFSSVETLSSTTSVDMEVDVQCNDVMFSTETENGVVEAPKVGMTFESREAAKLYYLKYAHQNGFAIRIRNSQRRGKCHNDFNETDFVCVREGKRVIQDENEASQVKKRNTTTAKCECKARMRVRLQEDEKKWRVTDFDNEHEHRMVSPDKKVLMKTVKIFPKVACMLEEKFREVNLPVSKVPSVCGAESYGFNKRDCYNHLNSKLKMYKTPEDGDATATYNYFKQKSVEDPRFFYAVQIENESRAVNFFWIDGRSREQYQHFGDVVLFDTTYRKNAYSMPFGPFTGLNHHFHCIQFVCALLLDETEESFVWLFETWLTAMGGRPPVSLLTDQDKAMTNAVHKVFPTTRHRFCLWHITSKFSEHLSHAYAKRVEFAAEMNKCLRGTHTVSEFEMMWEEMLEKNNLSGNECLRKLYEIRDTWVPVYFLDTFFGGQNTTGCSESMNNAYKSYFSSNCNLQKFVIQNERCLMDLALKERAEDYESEHKAPIVAESHYLLKSAGTLYTRNVYVKFKEQWEKALHYKLENVEDGKLYFMKSRKKNAAKVWKVELDRLTLHGSCQCKMFEFVGIPCRHLIKLFLHFDIDDLPSHFVLRRWTKRANSYRNMDKDRLVNSVENSKLLRLTQGTHMTMQVVNEASEDTEKFRLMVNAFTSLLEQFQQLDVARGISSVDDIEIDEVEDTQAPKVVLQDPNISQTEGRTKDRLKRPIESVGEHRICTGCGLRAPHNVRTCPVAKARKENVARE